MSSKVKNQTVPFVYRWTQQSTCKWYIGSHYAKGCHPDDGYICSSNKVKALIAECPTDWIREILEIGTDPVEIRFRENEILTSLNARMNPASYNETNGDGKFGFSGPHSAETRQRMKDNRPDFSGENNPMFGSAGGFSGKQHTEESKQKTSRALRGRLCPDEIKLKNSQAQTGRFWVNNGEASMRLKSGQSIPIGWVLGQLDSHIKKIAESHTGEKHWSYGTPRPAETRQKIAQSLIGHIETDETKRKKSESSNRRQRIMCDRCNNLYLACHSRHHTNCTLL